MHTASLVSITPGAEDQIVYCARVSNPANQENTKTGAKLLRFCMKHGHWSIFEQAHMTVEINTTPDISRQILRHHSFRFQEFSTRYSDVTQLGNFVIPELREQDTKNKQNSTDTLDPGFKGLASASIVSLFGQAFELYSYLLENGVAKECARAILPIGGIRTRLYASANVRDWIFYLKARTSKGTQLEHRRVAESILEIFAEQLPVVHEAAFE